MEESLWSCCALDYKDDDNNFRKKHNFILMASMRRLDNELKPSFSSFYFIDDKNLLNHPFR